jgi:Fe-S-cluster containining protein
VSSEFVPACLKCGACCFGESERYVPVSGDDHARLGDAAESLSVFLGNRCYMRMEAGHCAALELTDSGEFVCSIYAGRPDVCRELERGSNVCEAERERKHEHSEAALVSLHTRK